MSTDIWISYIIPFYKRADMMRVVAPFNHCFGAPHSEVVVALDEPTQEQEVLDLVRSLPQYRWRVIVNDEDHEWRPPCCAYNVGIRHALGDWTIQIDPETQIIVPERDYVENLVRSLWGQLVYIGGHQWDKMEVPIFISMTGRMYTTKGVKDVTCPPTFTQGYGFVGAPRSLVMLVGGYDEARTKWGCDEDLLWRLLDRFCTEHRIDSSIGVIHPAHDAPRLGLHERELGKVQRGVWEKHGRAYSRIAFDWRCSANQQQSTGRSPA